MKQTWRNALIFGLCTVGSALGYLLRPHVLLADTLPPLQLETAIPSAFGEWHLDPFVSALVINPQQAETLERLYSDTLSRTYVNSQGYRVMLSIAYGRNQAKDSQLHKPDLCYPAQGFKVEQKSSATLIAGGRALPVFRLETRLGKRIEPLQYWTVVGHYVTTSDTDIRAKVIRYALHDEIPDGMIVRLSSIDPNPDAAYRAQSAFADALLQAVPTEVRARLAGTP